MRARMWVSRLLALVVGLGATRLGWTEVQPGDTITKDNIAQAEALLTPSTRWMVEHGMPMQIIEAKKIEWPRAYKEATEKYAKQVTLAADGRELLEYVAGYPFPTIDINDPLAGFKIMWNFEQKPYDNVGSEYVAELVNSKGELERTLPSRWQRMMWLGRLYLDPKPVIPHAFPIHHTDLFGPLRVNDQQTKGMLWLYVRHLSPEVPDDTYVYRPHTLKFYRVADNPSDPVGGTDVDRDSWLGFNGKLSFWTFRLLAEKEILAVVHSGKYGDRSAWCAPRDGTHGILAALPCVAWEKRRVWVIEGTPSGYREPYAYSKRVLYIDQDFFGLVLTELYDQRGELWKFFVPCLFYAKEPYPGYPAHPLEGGQYHYEDEWPFLPNAVMVDIQTLHATTMDAPSGDKKPSEWLNEWYFNENVSSNTPEVYSLSYLKSIH